MTRSRNVLAAALLVPLGLAACEQAPTAPEQVAPEISAPSFSRSGVSQRFPIEFTAWNGCTEEDVRVTGVITRVSRVQEDQGGGYHWLENYSYHGTGVGLSSGTEYVYNEIHNMKENGDLPFDSLFDDTGAYYFTMSFIAPFISKGSAPNELFQWDLRYKMDRTGTVTIDEFRFEFLCRG